MVDWEGEIRVLLPSINPGALRGGRGRAVMSSTHSLPWS